ncbi:MAG TPA: aminotransferase class I/II-fold pyridoxal phosphate-dependent enzyme [Steroidobacteraceae bacterium]|jgi:DNA-binding transcriptional MocR family regulator
MPHFSELSRAELELRHTQIRQRYDAFAKRGVKLNLTRGKPSAAQLDFCNELLALPGTGDFMSGNIDCRNYGELQGLPELRALLAPVFGVTPDRVIVGENSSLSLMHDSIAFSLLKGTCDSERPWSKESRIAFLCPVPGYDRHFSICQEFGIEMIAVPLTEHGPDMDIVEKLVAQDAQIKGIWCIPKYSNPSGAVYSNETIERLAGMKTAARDFRIFWDNAYAVHHLTAERIEIANLDAACARLGNPNRAFIFGSTSKVTLAGAGVGLFAGSKENVAWYLKRIEKRTIGGDKVNQLRHIRFFRNTEAIAALMDRHRAVLAPKFTRVLEVFEEHLGNTGIATWTRPKGGYFITLDVADGCAKKVVKLAKEAGVELTPAGSTHPLGNDPHDRTIRIAPSFPELAEVTQAAEGVVLSVLLAGVEKALEGK